MNHKPSTINLQNLRQSGDIDIYLEGGLDKVLVYARTFGEVTKVNELEMSVPVYKDTEVEFHYRPFIMRNSFKNWKLQHFFKEQMDRKFSESIVLDEAKNLSINVPSMEFNLVHQMVHIYHHLFTEGIGLRQLMDYYFVLRTLIDDEGLMIRDDVLYIVHDLGLDKFASALMWVIGIVFEGNNNLIPPEHLTHKTASRIPWVPNAKGGRVLLNEVMLSGNLGKQDTRMDGLYDTKWNTFWLVNMKTLRFWRFDHWAWFWSPVWRVYHFIWKRINGFTK